MSLHSSLVSGRVESTFTQREREFRRGRQRRQCWQPRGWGGPGTLRAGRPAPAAAVSLLPAAGQAADSAAQHKYGHILYSSFTLAILKGWWPPDPNDYM